MRYATNTKRSHGKRSARLLMNGIAGAVTLVAAAQVQGQQASVQQTPSTNSDILTEVTVTAERRTENLQNVPISATVRSGQDLKDEGIYDIEALQAQVPSLAIQPPVGTQTYINIRGVGITLTSPDSSTGVAFYVDGMYIPSLVASVDTFYDLQNVEVLRGPQGTLVGTDADGGAIFVNSVKPSMDGVGGYVQQTIGSFNDYRTEGAVNLPISDTVAARLAFVHETRDSFYTNIGAYENPAAGFVSAYPPIPVQTDPGNVDFNAVRLQVLFKPADNLEFTVRFEPYQSRNDSYALKPDEAAVAPFATYYKIPASEFYDPYAAANQGKFVLDYDVPTYDNIHGQRTSGTLVWDISPAIRLKDVFSYQSGVESEKTSLDGDSAPDGSYQYNVSSFTNYTEEVNLLSTSTSPLQWVVGAYFLNSSTPLQLTQGSPLLGAGAALNIASSHRNYAAFASGTYSFSPEWSVTLGGRYSYDRLPFTIFGGTATTTDSVPTGSLKLNYQMTPQTLIYASLANGYKSGGENPFIQGLVPPAPYGTEKNVVEEIGLKTDFLDHHLRFDGDIFNSKYNHYQIIEVSDTVAGPLPYTQTPGNANIRGAEAELTGVIDALQFNLGVSYLDGKTAGAFNFLEPNGTTTISVPSGTAIPFAPDWTVTTGVQYGFHLWSGTLTPRLQYQFEDKKYYTVLNFPQAYPLNVGSNIPAYDTADFLMTYAAAQHWRIQTYVTNLANKTYVSFANISSAAGGPPVTSFGPPRQYGVRLGYNF